MYGFGFGEWVVFEVVAPSSIPFGLMKGIDRGEGSKRWGRHNKDFATASYLSYPYVIHSFSLSHRMSDSVSGLSTKLTRDLFFNEMNKTVAVYSRPVSLQQYARTLLPPPSA